MQSNAVLGIGGFQEASPVEVRDTRGYKGVFAQEDIREGLIIFYLKGTVSTQPTKYTVELGSQRHLTLPATRETSDDLAYCWQYLNHNCEPNAYLNTAELTFRALRNIERGEEISFNYLTTESKMAVPFHCSCGSPNCFGFIQGRNFLSRAEAKRLALAVGEDNVATLVLPAVVAKVKNT